MFTKPNKRTLSHSPRFQLDLKQFTQSPSTKSPKSSFTHHARHISANLAFNTLTSDSARLNTDQGYSTATDLKTQEDIALHNISSRIQKFKEFFQNNMNHLSEKSLRNINYDTLDHLTFCAQTSMSQRFPYESFVTLPTEANYTERKTSHPVPFSTPRNIRQRTEPQLSVHNNKKRPVIKSRDAKAPVNNKTDKEPVAAQSHHRKAFSLISQEILNGISKGQSKKIKSSSQSREAEDVMKSSEVLISPRISAQKRGKKHLDIARISLDEEKVESGRPKDVQLTNEVKNSKNVIDSVDAQIKLKHLNTDEKISTPAERLENSAKSSNLNQPSNNVSEGFEFDRKNSGSSYRMDNSSLTNIQRSIEGGDEFKKKEPGSISSINEYAKSLIKSPRKLKKNYSVAYGLKKSDKYNAVDPSEPQETKTHYGTMIFPSNNQSLAKANDFGKETTTQTSVKNLSLASTMSSQSSRLLMNQLTARSLNYQKDFKNKFQKKAKYSRGSNILTEEGNDNIDELEQITNKNPKNILSKTVLSTKSPNKSPERTDEINTSDGNKSQGNRNSRLSEEKLVLSQRENKGLQSSEKQDDKILEEMKKVIPNPEDKKYLSKFNFKKKNIKLLKKKHSSIRHNSISCRGLGEFHGNEFSRELENTVKAVVDNLFGSKNAGSISYKGFQRKFSEQTGMSQFEELLKQDFDEEGLKRGLTSDMGKLTKKNTFESEIASSFHRILTRTSSELQIEQNIGGILDKDLLIKRNTTITKPYPVKNWVITVNINPPIEEASPRMEEMEESTMPIPSIITPNDASELRSERKEDQKPGTDELQISNSAAVLVPSINISTRSKQYKFELNSRKYIEESIEEEKPLFEDIGLIDDLTNDESFRKQAENLFVYEGIEANEFEVLHGRAMMATQKNNFFSFIEQMISNPVSKKAHKEFFEMHKIEEPRILISPNIGELFRYHPKIQEIIFKFLEEFNLQQDAKLRNVLTFEVCSLRDLDSAEDEPKNTEKIPKISAFEITKNPQYMNLMTRITPVPILVAMDSSIIEEMKDPYTFFKVYSLNIQDNDNFHLINKIVDKFSIENWNFVNKAIFRTYEKLLFGFFENKIHYESCKITQGIESLKTMRSELLKLEKKSKRRPSVSPKKMESSSGVIASRSLEPMRKTKGKGSSKAAMLFKKAASKISTLKNENEEKNSAEIKGPVKRPGHIKPTDVPRKYSKTTIKPLISPLASSPNLEKFKTAQMEGRSVSHKSSLSINNSEIQIDNLPEPSVPLKMRTITIASEEETTETSNQLQIPTRSHASNLVKLQSSFLSGKEDKTKLFIEKLQARKNALTASNTLNSSTHKSLSPHSDTQTPNPNPAGVRPAVALKTERLGREQTSSNLVPPDSKEGKTERNSQNLRASQKDLDKFLLRPPSISIQQAAKTIIAHNTLLRSIPTMKDKKHAVRSKLIQNGPKAALFYAVHHGKQQEIQEILEVYPRDIVNVVDEQRNTLLIIAAQVGNKTIVNTLLERRVDINAQNVDGMTALHFSLMYGYDQITDLLLAHGARQAIVNNKGKTPWEMAAR